VEIDAAALAAREASVRAGIRNWAEELRRRGETEQSVRAMLVAELQEDALARQYETPVEESVVVDRYEQEKPEHTAKQGWIRTATVTVRPILATKAAPRITAVCDDFLTKYKRCIEEHAPEATQRQMIEAMHGLADGWLADAQRGKATELDVVCRAARDSATTSMARLGCDWDSAVPTSDALPPNKAELAETRRRAQILTTAARRPGELAQLANAEKLEVAIDDRLVAREALDPAVRKAFAGARTGQTSKPIAFNRGYRVIQVLELAPAGPLPLAHRRPEIIAALREEDREAPREQLRAELDQRYPIRYVAASAVSGRRE
jgi:parvulin-like peptidyl-prolyl isomerase